MDCHTNTALFHSEIFRFLWWVGFSLPAMCDHFYQINKIKNKKEINECLVQNIMTHTHTQTQTA